MGRNPCQAAVGPKSIWWRKSMSGIREEIWPDRVCKIRMVKQVVGFKAQLHFQALRDIGVLENGEIQLAEGRANEGVSALIAEVACARLAGAAVPSKAKPSKPTRDGRAGRGEGTQVEELSRVAVIVLDGTNDVRLGEIGIRAIIVVWLQESDGKGYPTAPSECRLAPSRW